MNKTKKDFSTALTDSIPFLTFSLLILWGSFAATSKLVLRELDSFQLQFWMFGTASVVLVAVLLFTGRIREFKCLNAGDIGRLVAISFPSYLYYFLYTLSLRLLPAVEASSLNYLFPILIVLFAVPMCGERLSFIKVFALLAGFAGTLVILTKGNPSSVRLTSIGGDITAVLGAVSFAVFSNLLKRNKVDMLLANTVFTLCSFVFSLASMLTFSHFTLPTLTSFSLSFWLGLSNIVLSYLVWNALLKKCSSSLSASISFMTPFSNIFFILLFLGESIFPSQLIGLAIIIAGIVLTSIAEIREKRTQN